jgi:hypothetical protein
VAVTASIVPCSATSGTRAASRPKRSNTSGGTGWVANIFTSSIIFSASPARANQSASISGGSGISVAGQPATRICASTRSGCRQDTYCANLPLMLNPTTANVSALAASATAITSSAS